MGYLQEFAAKLEELLRTRGLSEAQREEITAYVKEHVLQSYRNGVEKGRSSPVMVPTVSLGSIVQDKVPGWAGALDASELWRHGARRDALLGPNALAGRRVTFDWAAHSLIFEDRD